jgi:hypothetical protein
MFIESRGRWSRDSGWTARVATPMGVESRIRKNLRDRAMRHNEFDRESECEGELKQSSESTDRLTVLWCLTCFTEFRYIDSLVTVVHPGMRKSLDVPT